MVQLQARNLQKQYGRKVVVANVHLHLQQGEVIGLLGPNGAGKTTTFYMLVGIIKPNAGRIFVDDRDISHWPLHRRARYGLSYLPQESSVFQKLTVRQNLEIVLEYTPLDRKRKKTKATQLLQELGIARLEHQKAALLSGGERRRLEIARSLIQNPKFILLDEPFAGIDPLAVDDIQSIMTELREKGIGVLISDHNVRETMDICDRVYLVHEGHLILEGTPGEIAADSKARQVYLGEGFHL